MEIELEYVNNTESVQVLRGKHDLYLICEPTEKPIKVVEGEYANVPLCQYPILKDLLQDVASLADLLPQGYKVKVFCNGNFNLMGIIGYKI